MPAAKIIILSDIHILPDGGRIIGIDPSERLELAIAHINRTQADADLCIITGDLTHKGDPESYAILRHLLSGLTIPVKILIGNHDNRANFRAAFPDADTDQGVSEWWMSWQCSARSVAPAVGLIMSR